MEFLVSRPNFKRLVLSSTIAAIFLAGCGGGGDDASAPAATSTILSGTVAGGAAVIGTVLVTDSKGVSKGGTIEANGHYSIDVNGMTGPFILKANGTVGNTTVTYFSAATTADLGNTVNVTPFTNLIVSNIAAQMAETYFSDPANIAKIGTMITPTSLAAAQTALHAKLQPVLAALGVSNSIDLLRSSFAADHSGIDAVLDLVKVEVDMATNIVTLKNALNQAVIATDDASLKTDDATPVDSATMTGMTLAAVTDLQAVVTKLNAFAALFATSLPSLATLQNSGVFDTSSSFMMSGQTFAEFVSELSTDPEALGLKFSNVDIALDASGAAATLTAVITSKSSDFGEKIELLMTKVNGAWLVQGDGRIADISINAQAQRDEWSVLASANQTAASGFSYTNGLRLNIDPSSYNASHAGALAVSALITGPGLGNGVTMIQDDQTTWFKVKDGVSYNTNVIPECGTVVNAAAGQFTVTTQCVSVAQAVDNSVYTVILKNASGVSLNGAGYQLTLPKQPLLQGTLTAAMFPAFTSITIDGQALTPGIVASGKAVAVNWTLPTGVRSDHMNVWANITGGASYFNVGKDLLPTATNALIDLGTLTASGTINMTGAWLSGVDAFGRTLAISKSVQVQLQ